MLELGLVRLSTYGEGGEGGTVMHHRTSYLIEEGREIIT